MLKVVGKRRNYTRLEERATGERWGGRGVYGDVDYIDLGPSTAPCQDWWYCLYVRYRNYSFISRYSDWLMN